MNCNWQGEILSSASFKVACEMDWPRKGTQGNKNSVWPSFCFFKKKTPIECYLVSVSVSCFIYPRMCKEYMAALLWGLFLEDCFSHPPRSWWCHLEQLPIGGAVSGASIQLLCRLCPMLALTVPAKPREREGRTPFFMGIKRTEHRESESGAWRPVPVIPAFRGRD